MFDDIYYLNKAVLQAKLALEKGNSPFGSILVLDDEILFEGHNEISDGDNTKHPEFAIAKYATKHLTLEERKRAIVYTSGEHCPMCAAAHAWVGLGKIVYAFSSLQLSNYLSELNVTRSNVKALPINEVIDNTLTVGPFLEFEDEIKLLHKTYYKKINSI